MERYYISVKGFKCIRHIPVDCIIEGEVVCGDCGLVMEDKMVDTNSESFHSLDGYMNKSRTGAKSKLSIHDKGLTTVMGKQNKDHSGATISGKKKASLDRLRLWDSRSKQQHKERSLTKAFTILNNVGSKLSLSEVIIEDSAYICRKATNENITRGRSISELIGACIYLSCRQNGFPKTLDEIADILLISRKRLSRSYRKIVFELNIKVEVPRPSEYLNQICNKLELSEKLKRYALRILIDLDKKDTVNAKPNLIAAAAVWYAVKKYKGKVSQLDIAKIANTSAISLRKYAQDERFVKVVEEIESL